MRVGLILDQQPGPELLAEAALSDRLGLDLLWIPNRDVDGSPRSAMAVAAALSTSAPDIEVVVEVAAADHPLELAEEVAVTDQLLGGRLNVAVRSDDPVALEECLDVLGSAFLPAPFRHDGHRWALPGAGAGPRTIRVMPPPASLHVPLFLVGAGHVATAVDRGLPLVMDSDDEAGTAREVWMQMEERLGIRATAFLRPALRDLRHLPLDQDGTVSALCEERTGWGLNTVAFRLPIPCNGDERRRAVASLAGVVRARTQMDGLPPELTALWQDQARRRGGQDDEEPPP